MDVGRFFICVNPAPPAISFRRSLLSWYRKHGRDLPWRRTTDPYAILVSEFMLQQTQVSAVIPYYNEWMRRFPDFAALAAASEQEVLHAWQGLGYYTRARNLRATAITILEKHRGMFPRRLADIEELPGIGRYTARAVATFAFDQSVPIVEANIARLLARLSDLQVPIDTSAGREMLWSTAKALLPDRAAGVHNSALMDLGALVCTTRPKCELCPVKTFCRASDPSALPRKKPRRALELRTEHHSFSLHRRRVLLEQSRDRWQGMWMLPRLALAPTASEALHLSQFPFTHHRITLAVYAHKSMAKRNQHQRWFRINELPSVPLPSPHRRALNQILALS
ncbi:MAG: A/G-specific adenine glycosylase [Verrucomicrobiota bacterium]